MTPKRSVASAIVLGLALLLGAPGMVPAQGESASPGAATPADEPGAPTLLFAQTIPADYLPDNPVWVDVYRMEWDPGATWPYAETYRSLRVWCVEEGRLAIAADGPLSVTRSASESIPATPGTEVEFGPGDCAVAPPEGPYTLRNAGPGQTVVAHGMVVPANVDVPAGYPFGQVHEEEPFGSSMYSFDVPAGPVALRLERAPLPPGAGRQEATELFPAAPDDAVRVIRIARRPDPAVAYAITVGAAPAVEASPAAETLLSVMFPAGVFPPDATQVELIRYAVAPGTSLGFPNGFVTPHAELAYVLEGTYAVRAAAPLLLFRQGATEPEEVPAETEITLGPGDAFAIPKVPVADLGKDALGELRNSGPEPLEVIGIAVWVESPIMAPAGMDLRWYTYLDLLDPDRAQLAAASVALVLQRVVLAPGAILPAPAPAASRLVVEEAAGATRQPGADGGAIRNDGQEPLVLLVLTLEAAEGAMTA